MNTSQTQLLCVIRLLQQWFQSFAVSTKIDVKAISLITDYDAHRTYIVPYVDAYVLAEPDMATKLIDEYGVDKSIIYPLGIPIFDRFTEPFDKKAICEREGLDPNKPTILLMAGSFGVQAC